MKINNKKILNWLLVFFWLGVIYFFSDQPNLKSELKPVWDLVLRKLAHISEFFILAFLLFRAYSAEPVKDSRALVFSLISSAICAGYDEWHQSFVAGRTAALTDVAIDSFGAGVFCALKYFEVKKKL